MEVVVAFDGAIAESENRMLGVLMDGIGFRRELDVPAEARSLHDGLERGITPQRTSRRYSRRCRCAEQVLDLSG